MATLIGQELGGYRIISQVGKGGMATVYKAFQASLDRYVAVKVMPPFYAQEDETFIKRFRREAQSIAKLRHPNILLVIDFGEHDNLIYIVMEFVDAGTLTDRLGSPMPEPQAVKIMDQIASALDYAHMQGLVHRDVKPSNILLPKPDWPLLTDFGLAKIVGGSQLTLTGTIAGTPAYMSPEQGQGESVDSRSDIYSLGIVLYEMMTGAVPYHAETPMAVVVKHIIEPLPLPTTKNPKISEAIERVILKALAKDPDDRYQRATELALAFREAIGEPAAIQGERPTILEEVDEQSELATVVDPVDFEQPLVESMPPADPVVTEKPPPISYPVEPQAVESAPEILPGAPDRSITGLVKERPWLKWLLPAGAAAAALCAIGMLIAFVIVPSIRDQIETQTHVSTTMTVDEHVLQGHQYFEAADYENAIISYEAAMAQGGDDVEMFFSLATAYQFQDRLEEALSVVDRAIRSYPDHAGVHELAGRFYQDLEYYYEAIREYELALSLEPDATWYLEDLADSYRAVGEYAKADEILAGGGKPQDEEDPYELENQGWDHLYSENYSQAEEAFLQALEIQPDLVSSWDGLSEVYWYQGFTDEAINALLMGIEANEDSAYLYEKLGWFYYYTEDYPNAEWAFNSSLFYDPLIETAWEGLADVYWIQGDLVNAAETLNVAVGNIPDSTYLYWKLGYLHYERGEYKAAIEALDSSIKLDPQWSNAYKTLADTYYIIGDVDKSFEVLEAGVTANYDRSDLHEALGWYHYELGQYQDALAAFNESVAVYVESGWPYIGIARTYTILGDWDAASEALENADFYSYDDPAILVSIGWGYADLGDCATAVYYFNRTLEIDPYNESAPDGLGYCAG